MDLPLPEFIQRTETHNNILVRLRNDYKQRKVWLDSDAANFVGEVVFKTLNQSEKRAINYIAERNEISVSDLMRLTQSNWHQARDILRGLVEKGILKTHIEKKELKHTSEIQPQDIL